MNYYNINKNQNLVLSEDKKFSKNELKIQFENFIKESGYHIESWINQNSTPYELIIANEERKIHLHLFLKNITGAGWEDKPKIKRVQVKNVRTTSIKDYVKTSNRETLMILGYYNYDDNPIMVAWDAYRYIRHNTIRSCYVNVDTLQQGYSNGYFVGTDSDQKVWLFDTYHFEKFVEDYIKYQNME